VALDADRVFVADRLGGLRIFDAARPEEPTRLGSFERRGRFALGVSVVGSHAFLASRRLGITVLDVSNPGRPRTLAVIDTPGEAWDVQVVDDLVFVADGSAGLRILDVSGAF
jgi:hypothetical protein